MLPCGKSPRCQLTLSKTFTKKRNNSRSPALWSPIAALLSIRCSALGSTIRLGTEGHSTPLKRIITGLPRDEKKISLNEDEYQWLEDNHLQSYPYEWNEWKNEFSDIPRAAKELLQIRGLLSKENRMEFRRIHGGKMNRLQEAADAGRIGGILRDITGQDSSFLMESLRDGDNTITDGHTVHKIVTSFFAKWFCLPPAEVNR